MRDSRILFGRGPLDSGLARRVEPGRLTTAVLVASIALVLAVVPTLPAGAAGTAPDASSSSSGEPASGSEPGEPTRAPATTPAPSPSPEPVTVGVDTPATPIALPLALTGSRSPGTEVQVQPDDGSGQPLCIAPASSSTSWSCVVRSLPSGPSVPLRIVAVGPSGDTARESLSVAWLGAPTLVASDRATTAGQVGGTGYPGATVTARLSEVVSSCSATVDGDGRWTCVLSEPLPSGGYTATAVQSAGFYASVSETSAPARVLIDKDPPGTPSIVSPAAGSTVPLAGATFTGRGEDGNSVILFAGVRPLCQVTVASGSWSCRAAAVPAGTYDVTAMQMDQAGNASAASPALSLTFSESQPSAAPAPSAGGVAPSGGSNTGGTGGTGTPPSGSGSAPDAGQAPEATAPQGSTAPRWVESLRAPTALGTSLAPLASVAGPQVLTAAGLAAGTVALIIVPVLLGRRALRVSPRRLPSMTGRNRSRSDAGRFAEPLLDRWTRAVLATATAAGLLVLSMPVIAQSNSLRLAAAAGVAVVVLNLATTVAVVRVARAVFAVPVVTVTRLPLLALTALTAMLSRFVGLAPPLVSGQILGARFAPEATARQRSGTSLAQLLVAGGLALVGWAVYSVVPGTSEALVLFSRESASLLTLTAAASAALGALPFGTLPGAAVLARSRILWVSVTTLTWSLLFLILTAVTPSDTAPALSSLVAVALGLSVVSAGAWLWTRWVEPFLKAS